MRLLGSTGFAMTLLALIFLYSSVGSALPPVRQGLLADWLGWEALRFEMTEMEWFSTWPFVFLVLLFCLSIIVATVRRIPFSWFRLGEWTVHAGIVVMVVGCLIYFGRKVEGDAVIYQRAALIHAPGMSAPERLVVRPGGSADAGAGGVRYRVSVSRIVPRSPIPTESGREETAMAVWFDVQRLGAGEPSRFTRVMFVGHPMLTQDFPSGGMRAAATQPAGNLMDDGLRIDFDYEPQDAFYLDHTAAVYARDNPRGEWVEMPVAGLPRYAEHLSSTDGVWLPGGGATLPLRPIRIEAAPRPVGGAAVPAPGGIRAHVVGFLPYAREESRWGPGGDRLNPVIRFSLSDGQDRQIYDLAAFDPQRNHLDFNEVRFRIEFRWASSAQEREQLAAPHRPRLEFRVPGREAPVELALSDILDKGPQPLPGTDYKVTVGASDVMANFPLMSEAMRGRSDTVVIVHVERGDKRFQRLVFARFEDQSRDFDDAHRPLPAFVDPDLRIRFLDPSPAGMLIIAGPAEDVCDIVTSAVDGSQVRHAVPVGSAPATQPGLPLRIESLITHAVQVTRPAIVPRAQRQPLQSVGATMSMIAVEVDDGTARHRVWLPYNDYPFPHEGYAYPERFQYGSYAPRSVTLSNGRSIELMYSRQRRYLPAAIALERFVLETLPGGQRERDFISLVRFYENGGWSAVREVRSNHPAEYRGLWFYQAQWDPRNEALTVLGVGNRRGIAAMLAGVVLSIVGMAYSFYAKPWLLRRARAAASGVSALGPPVAGAAGAIKCLPLLLVLGAMSAGAAPVRAESSAFAGSLDLSRIRLAAVQNDGRLKPFDTLAREIVQQIAGDSVYEGQDPVYTYLDLMLNPSAYVGRNLVYVKKARVRQALIHAAGRELTEADVARIRRTRRFTLRSLSSPAVQQAIEELERDMSSAGTARDANLLQNAMALANEQTLRRILLLVPPPGGTSHAPWMSVDDVLRGRTAAAGLDGRLRDELSAAWRQLETAWRAADAASANDALGRLAGVLARVDPGLYPDRLRLAVEHAYYRCNKLMGAWVLYLVAFVCLLPAFLMRAQAARRVGMLAFVAALILHTVSVGVRWYLARRIPIANMFEAVTATAWAAAASALILEVWLRRSPARNLFALGAAFCGTLALACGYFMTMLLPSAISNPMPILNTVWLKIHVTLILISYALIVVSFVTASLYLLLRAFARTERSGRLHDMDVSDDPARAAAPGGPAVTDVYSALFAAETPAMPSAGAHAGALRSPALVPAVVLSLAGSVLLAFLLKDHAIQAARAVGAAATAGAWVGRATYVLLIGLTIVLGPAFALWLVAGTGRIIFGPSDAPNGRRSPLLTVLDGSTMLLIQLAFITLWVGIILGAAWADVSWGRPWGWDPKEVFALNTWLIFVGLIHIRLNVREKEFWTAVLAVAGFVVMMFNWIGVNFFLVGLHSYA